MYGQANYGPQFGQGPRTPMPAANHQRPPVLPPPPLKYQQGPSGHLPPVIQQATCAIPPQIGQQGPYLYQHGFPPPPPTLLQSPPITFHGMPNSGQSYAHPPPSGHGSTFASQGYPNAQHNVQHPSHTRTLNLHHIPPLALVPPRGPPPCPNMLEGAAPHRQLPPPPPRPPVATQGPTFYKALHPPQPPNGGAQGLQHIPLPPPPSNPNLFTPTTIGGSVHPPPASTQLPSPQLPTLPPSSSSPKLATSNFPGHPDSHHSSTTLSSCELRDLDSVDVATDGNEVRNIKARREGSQDYEGGRGREAGSLDGDGLPSSGSLVLDLSPPPPKPSDEKIVHKIESFCQLIAKNGPGIEEMTCQNESGNSEFEFLFGGEPGSGAAIAHEYFVWMKKKHISACKLREGQSEVPLKSPVIDSSSQPEHLMVSSRYGLPDDSDMEMEDDITLSERDQGVDDSIDAPNCKYDFSHEALDVKKLLSGTSPERSTAQCVPSEKVSCSLSSELCEISAGTNLLFDQGRSTSGKKPSRFDKIYSTGVAECPLASDLEKSSNPIADDQKTLSAPAVAEVNNLDRVSNQLSKVGSPSRLLQEYASHTSSENDNEASVEDVNVVIVSPSVSTVAKSSDKDAGSQLMTEMGSESPCMTDKDSRPPSELKESYKAAKFSSNTQKEVKDGTRMDVVSRMGKSQESKKAKFETGPSKVDEFGRLVREGSSDSNSDDSRYNKRHNKRGRSRIHSRSRSRSHSRSRSQSPFDSRRRSSWRRTEKRSRSRSRSLRNQRSRSRSRSPTFRRTNEFRDGGERQDRRQIPECFDFLRGRCYRGAHCRYMHREYDKNDGSRQHRSKPTHFESQPSLKNSRTKEEVDEIKAREMQLSEDEPIARKYGQLIDTEKMNCESSRVTDIAVQVKQIIPENLRETTTHIPDRKEFQEVQKSHHPSPQLIISSADNMKSSYGTSENVLLMNKSIVEQPQSNNSVALLQKADCPSEQGKDSFITEVSPVRASTTSPDMVSSNEPLPNAIASTNVWPIKSSIDRPLSSQFMAPNSKELPLSSISAANVPYLSELPLPPPPPPTQVASSVHAPQMDRDYNLMPLCPPQSISYQDSLPNQHAQFSLPPNSPWTSLPPPPPPPPPPPRPLYDSSLNAGTTARGGSSQFQQNLLVPRNDFGSQTSIRPYSTEWPSHSQAGDFLHHMYTPMQEFPRPVLHRADFGSGNSSQPFGGPGRMREDHFTHAPGQDLNSSNAFAHGNIHLQPGPPSRELTMNKLQNFSGDNFPSGELLNSSSQIHPRSQNQQPTYSTQYPVGDSILGVPGKAGVQYPVGDSILGFPGKDGPTSQYHMDLVDRNQSSRLPDFGASRIPTHHNLYASTFEQPLSSKFSSNILNQENGAPSGNMFDTTCNLRQVPVDGRGGGSVGSRQTTSSPSSARAAGQLLPKSDGEQYDPLLDSIEPPSALLKKHGHGQKQESAGDSNIIVRLNEKKQHKEVETVASATSLDIDEFGETADAEVGGVEYESLSDPDGAANMAGEIEIDQVESPGKSKKKKDSRSTRLFKIAIANFVKEILKPSWRQGNMSKEVFKTIVKKTVDKVSGAMKKHQIPKSEAKITHYIDSSQRKLTKLVMGYVDKYVNV